MLRFGVVLLLCGCTGTCGEPPALPAPDALSAPVVRRPRRDVRAYPPHAIRTDGIGPYVVGASQFEVLHTLPEGPRLSIVQLGRYANWQIVRAEGGALLIGIDSTKRTVGFVAVLSQPIARTERGVGVGATAAELIAAYGEPVPARSRARDRWAFEFDKLPGVRFLTDASPDTPRDAARVSAVVVTPRPDAPEKAEREPHAACREAPENLRGKPEAELREELVARALPDAPAGARFRLAFGCFTSAIPEAAVWIGPQVHVVALGDDRRPPRKLATIPATADPTLLAALDVDHDGRDELVIGGFEHATGTESANDRVSSLRIYRWSGGPELVLDERPYVISEGMALAVGATPAQIDLALDVWAQVAGQVTVSGLYLARQPGGGLRDLVPLRPQSFVMVRKAGGQAPAPDAAAPPQPAEIEAPPAQP